MNKSVHLDLSIFKISKKLMYEFWYDYVKLKYRENANVSYMDIDSFTIYIKTRGIYVDFAENIERRFDTSNYELDRPLPKGINNKVIGLMKDELG